MDCSRTGGTGGHFTKITRDHQVVSKLEAWQISWALTAVELTFTDSSKALLGKKNKGSLFGSFEIDVHNGEVVTELTVWGNGSRSEPRCGGFKIVTNRGRTFSPKQSGNLPDKSYSQQVGSGIIVGCQGYNGYHVDSLAFLMLRNVKNVDMIDIGYSLSKQKFQPPQKKIVLDTTKANPYEEDCDAGASTVQKSKMTSGSWNITAGLNFGNTYKVKGGVPFIKDVRAKNPWQVSVSGIFNNSWTAEEEDEASFQVIVPAKEKVRYVVSRIEYTLDKLPFSASLKHYLDNETYFLASVSGFYNGLSSQVVKESYLVGKWSDVKGEWVDFEPVNVGPKLPETSNGLLAQGM